MSYALYITHPEVVLDPAQPPTRWHLSPRGRERAAAFGQSALMRAIGLIISSPETKTMEMPGRTRTRMSAIPGSPPPSGSSR